MEVFLLGTRLKVRMGKVERGGFYSYQISYSGRYGVVFGVVI
jgi:hypothetical protein